ncbi:MAG: hypothetical protein HYR84_03640, partial [Planctomycetes bacterium]|nr:hypothetical protein [Planctomycetota bacterium]
MSAMRSWDFSNLLDSVFFGAGRSLVLLVPAALLAASAIRSWEQKPWLLLGGLAFQLLVLLMTFF